MLGWVYNFLGEGGGGGEGRNNGDDEEEEKEDKHLVHHRPISL